MNVVEAVPKVVALTLSLLVSLSQWFGDGIDAYTNKRYVEAAAAFTKVIDAKVESNPLHDISLYWRAQCRIQQNDLDAARQDLEELLKRAPEGPLAVRAAEDYRLATGKPWDGLLLTTPRNTWKSFIAAISKEDVQTVEKCCTGNLKSELLEYAKEEESFWPEISKEVLPLEPTSVTYNAASNKALVVLAGKVDGKHEEERIVMTIDEGRWLLADEFKESMADEFKVVSALTPEEEEKEAIDRKRLETFRLAFKTYLTTEGRMPRRLSDLERYVKDFATVSVSAMVGRPFVLGVAPDGRPGWIFTATAYANRRHAYMNGDVKTLPEDEFQAEATKYGIRVPTFRGDRDLTQEEQESLKKLIGQLGAREFKARREAYDALKAAGAAASPFLEKATDHPDPEIAIQAQKLLEDL